MRNLIDDNDRFQRKLNERAARSTGFRVLVVDDEPSILELVKTALETLENYQVAIAISADEAIEIIDNAEDPFDSFLLDIQMPEVSGIELLREIRRLPEYTDTPVLMLTAMSDRKYIDRAFLEGASDYVNKPFDFLELRSRIKSAHSLVEARRQSEDDRGHVSDTAQAQPSGPQFAFADPFSLVGVGRTLGYIEFDNYINQLTRMKLFSSRAVSVILQDAELFFNLAGGNSFHNAILAVAGCIERATHEMDCVFSYRGGGVFLLILHGSGISADAATQNDLGALIGAELQKTVNDERIEVLVGRPVSMRVLSRTSTPGVLQKAVSAVQQLEAELRKHDDYARSFDVGDPRAPTPGAQKRVYESVLHELFGEESYLNLR